MGNIENMEKIHIAVCDDDELTHREVEEKLIEYRESRKCGYKLSHYNSAQMLLNETEEIHILLLDIDMPVMDGIEAVAALKKSGRQCNIIMLTSKRERFKDAFKIGATRFVTKPIEKDELFEARTAQWRHSLDMAQSQSNIMGKIAPFAREISIWWRRKEIM